MVRNYERTTDRGKWSEDNLRKAMDEVKNKGMSVLAASKQFNVPRKTLERRLKTGKIVFCVIFKYLYLIQNNLHWIVIILNRYQCQTFLGPSSCFTKRCGRKTRTSFNNTSRKGIWSNQRNVQRIGV